MKSFLKRTLPNCVFTDRQYENSFAVCLTAWSLLFHSRCPRCLLLADYKQISHNSQSIFLPSTVLFQLTHCYFLWNWITQFVRILFLKALISIEVNKSLLNECKNKWMVCSVISHSPFMVHEMSWQKFQWLWGLFCLSQKQLCSRKLSLPGEWLSEKHSISVSIVLQKEKDL